MKDRQRAWGRGIATRKEGEVLPHGMVKAHKLQAGMGNDQWTATWPIGWSRRPVSDPAWSYQHRVRSETSRSAAGESRWRGKKDVVSPLESPTTLAISFLVTFIAAPQAAGRIPASRRHVVPGQAIEAAPDEIRRHRAGRGARLPNLTTPATANLDPTVRIAGRSGDHRGDRRGGVRDNRRSTRGIAPSADHTPTSGAPRIGHEAANGR